MASFRQKRGSLWITCSILVYGTCLSFLSFRKFAAFSYHDFDLAVYAQGLWTLLRGSLRSSLLGVPILGNHFVPILFLIAPLYALFPTPLILLVLQSFLLGGGAWFIHRLSRQLLDGRFAATFSVVYLLYPALAFVNLFEFHPVAFALFFLLGALEAFERNRLGLFSLFVILALTCQEDVSLFVAAIGIYALMRRRSVVWILAPLGLGVGWFCVAVLFLMPRWNPDTINFSLLYAHLGGGPLEVFRSILLHPVKTLSLMLEGSERKLFIVKMLAPLGFLPLLDPAGFFLTLPGFLEQLLSRREMQHLLKYHYATLLIPFLFFAAIHGLRRLLMIPAVSSNRRSVHLLLVGLALISAVGFGPLKSFDTIGRELRSDLIDQKRRELIQRVPADASVAATFEFLPHLANRRSLYPLHRFYTGFNTLSRKPYLYPPAIDVLLADLNDPLTLIFMQQVTAPDKRWRPFMEGWRVREAFGDLVYLERGEGPFLIQPVESFSRQENIHVEMDDTIVLTGLHGLSHEGEEGGTLFLTFLWECRESPRKQYGLLFSFLDRDKRLVFQQYHSIGYRFLPTVQWKKGERFEETYRLVLPRARRGESSYELTISCVDEKTEELVSVEAEGETATQMSFGWIEVRG